MTPLLPSAGGCRAGQSRKSIHSKAHTKQSLLELFAGRPPVRYFDRAFFEPGVFGWPDHACRGCSMLATSLLTSPI